MAVLSQCEFPFVREEVDQVILPFEFRIADIVRRKLELNQMTNYRHHLNRHILVLLETHKRARESFNWFCEVIHNNGVPKQIRYSTQELLLLNSRWTFTSNLTNCKGRSLDIALYPECMSEIAVPCLMPCMW